MRLVLQGVALATSAVVLSGCGLLQDAPHRQEARVTLRVADAAMEAGAPDMALRVAEIVLQREPNDVAAIVAKANALYALGAANQARAAYRQAVAADPGNPDAQIGLGRTLVRHDPRGAEAAFLAALAHDPDNVLALNDLGIARDMLGQHQDAQKAYRQALTVSPDSSDVKTNLELSLVLSGDHTGSMRTLPPVAISAETPIPRADVASKLPAAPAVVSVGAAPVDAVAPLAITAVPATAVHREALVVKPAQPIAVAEAEKPVATPEVDLLAVKADASAVLPVSAIPTVVQRAVALPATAAPGPVSVVPTARVAVGVAAKPPPASPAKWPGGYLVQMGALDSARGALAEWTKLRARWPDLMAGLEPTVQQADVNQRIFWRLRTGGFADAGSANGFCMKLQVAGTGCWTVAATPVGPTTLGQARPEPMPEGLSPATNEAHAEQASAE